MNIMSVLHSNNAFSDALEGVSSMCERCSQRIVQAIYKILRTLVCTQRLSYFCTFSFALFYYNDVVAAVVPTVAAKRFPITQFSSLGEER